MSKKTKRDQLTVALNTASKDDAPEWAELLPPGQTVAGRSGEFILGRDGRLFSVSNSQAVIDASLQHLEEYGAPIDECHKIQLEGGRGGSAPAYGWVTDYRVNARGGIEGKIDWNSLGEEALNDKQYRYISVAVTYYELDDGVQHVVAIIGGGLTNGQNLQVAALNQQKEPKEEAGVKMKNPKLLTALNVSADATDEQLETAMLGLVEKLDGLETDLNTAREQLRAQAKAEHQMNVDTALNAAKAAGKIVPAEMDPLRNMAADETGLNRVQALIDARPAIDLNGTQVPQEDPSTKTSLNQAQKDVFALMGVSEADVAEYGTDD